MCVFAFLRFFLFFFFLSGFDWSRFRSVTRFVKSVYRKKSSQITCSMPTLALCEVKLLSSGSVAAVVDVVVVHPFPSAAPRKRDSNSDTPKK